MLTGSPAQGAFKIGARRALSARSCLEIKFAWTRLSALLFPRFLNALPSSGAAGYHHQSAEPGRPERRSPDRQERWRSRNQTECARPRAQQRTPATRVGEVPGARSCGCCCGRDGRTPDNSWRATDAKQIPNWNSALRYVFSHSAFLTEPFLTVSRATEPHGKTGAARWSRRCQSTRLCWSDRNW